ncbi:hypothetical protein MMA231_03873 (plasmid) [Asticcacaulis sp. MM231]|uniref:BLUF domain-containing protein n=1 Tax=Asticcacaulis sp. MM231 TaxID=3157666 RepID=UPI0032D56A40
MLFRLIYTSRYVRGHRGPLSDFRGILKSSRRYNYSHHITGCLFFDKSSFLQILEGSALALDTLLERIQGDVRHIDFKVLMRSKVARRHFGVWAMGGAVRSAAHDEIFAKYGISDDFPDNLPEDAIVTFCEEILNLEEKRPVSRVLIG